MIAWRGCGSGQRATWERSAPGLVNVELAVRASVRHEPLGIDMCFTYARAAISRSARPKAESECKRAFEHHVLERELDRQVERAKAAFQRHCLLAHGDWICPPLEKEQ